MLGRLLIAAVLQAKRCSVQRNKNNNFNNLSLGVLEIFYTTSLDNDAQRTEASTSISRLTLCTLLSCMMFLQLENVLPPSNTQTFRPPLRIICVLNIFLILDGRLLSYLRSLSSSLRLPSLSASSSSSAPRPQFGKSICLSYL